ncbi:MAG TPA: ATP-binding protein [Holophagaceae bacterium]|nr:ATP-binding protein [Holophagaceae bacterium]
MTPSRRNPELTRLYLGAGLVVLIVMIIMAYKTTGLRVDTAGIDAPSRWALIALGLANVLAIGFLLFIVIRSVAKLYFERRSGILGARLRTRLVLALFVVCLAPSLMLFLVGRNFISKNVERWFSPETALLIKDASRVAAQVRADAQARLAFGAGRIQASGSDDCGRIRAESGLDLVARLDPGSNSSKVAGLDLAAGLPSPALDPLLAAGTSEQDSAHGLWLLQALDRGDGRWIGGVYLPEAQVAPLLSLEQRARESAQLRAARDTLETLPQRTFLFLALLALFFAVWVGLTLARTITEPVRALAKAAQRVGAGDLQVELPVAGEDELAFLSSSFNTMIADLRHNREALLEQSQRLEQGRAYLDRLLAALPVGVMSWRPDGELVSANAAARRLLGVDPTLPPSWVELGRSPSAGRLPELVEKARTEGRSSQEELRLGREGEGRVVRAIIEPLSGGGALAVLEDLSQLASAEKRAAWQEVARRMAHEVKNPLTPIQLTAQRLLRRAREERLDPETVRSGAETILGEVASLARLVDSFSRFAKLPAPNFGPCDAGDLVRQVASLYGPNHPRVAWRMDIPEGPFPAAWDADLVKGALINLVDNALGALEGRAEDGGTVGLRLERRNGDYALIVEDDGPGVPEEARGRLFEPYFSTKRKGTGLGLAIVRRTAEDHGGEVLYEPLEPGSRFILRLPARAA